MSKLETGDVPLLYFDSFAGGYWRELGPRFLRLGSSDAKLHLREAGLYDGKVEEGLNEVEKALYVAQTERNLDYAGPLAGHRTGLYTSPSGERYLVTSEARECVWTVPKPQKRTFPHLERFLDELLPDGQATWFNAWLKYAAQSLRAGDFRAGQILVLAGPSGCGKSLCQALITEALGGRSADPLQYLTGETPFNQELAEAEHWCMEEATGSTDIRTRIKFGDAIKVATVKGLLKVHGKGKKGFSVVTFRRPTLSLNDESERLLALPPLNADLLDKVMLLHCARAKLSEDKAENWGKLTGDLPAYLAWLAKWRVPESMRDTRYGVRAYQHPELAEMLADLSPEARLIGLIDEVFFSKANVRELARREHDEESPWRCKDRVWHFRGPAIEVEKMLRASALAFAADRLLGGMGNACGTYLGRLSRQKPDRVQCIKSNGRSEWVIRQP